MHEKRNYMQERCKSTIEHSFQLNCPTNQSNSLLTIQPASQLTNQLSK